MARSACVVCSHCYRSDPNISDLSSIGRPINIFCRVFITLATVCDVPPIRIPKTVLDCNVLAFASRDRAITI
jgi:hypothetical protein